MTDPELNPWREDAERGFEDPRDQPQGEERKSGFGCLTWGCLIVVLVGVVLAISASVGGYYLMKGLLEQYTELEPMAIPIVELPEGEMTELQQRVEAFRARFEDDAAEGDAAPPAPADDGGPLELTLTAEELNALVARNPDLKGRVFLTIEDGIIGGEVSIPTDAVPLAGGRYLNATAKFDVDFSAGDLTVKLVDATVKGEPLPQAFLDAMANEDLAEDLEKEPDVKPILERIESLRVVGDQIVLTARDAGALPASVDTAPAPAPPSDLEGDLH